MTPDRTGYVPWEPPNPMLIKAENLVVCSLAGLITSAVYVGWLTVVRLVAGPIEIGGVAVPFWQLSASYVLGGVGCGIVAGVFFEAAKRNMLAAAAVGYIAALPPSSLLTLSVARDSIDLANVPLATALLSVLGGAVGAMLHHSANTP